MLDTSSSLPHVIPKPLLLVVDPKPLTPLLHTFFKARFALLTAPTLGQARQFLSATSPLAVYISSRFSLTKVLSLMEGVKWCSTKQLIPLVFGLDLTQPLITLPGTRWAGKLGLVTPDMSETELEALFQRLFKVQSHSPPRRQ